MGRKKNVRAMSDEQCIALYELWKMYDITATSIFGERSHVGATVKVFSLARRIAGIKCNNATMYIYLKRGKGLSEGGKENEEKNED